MNPPPRHVRQTEVAPLKWKGQLLVINAQQVQHGGVQVVHVKHVFDRVVTQFIRGAVAPARSPTTAASPPASRVGNQPWSKPSSGGGSQQSSSNKQAEMNKNDRSPTPTLTFGGRATVEPQKLSKAERKQMRRAA